MEEANTMKTPMSSSINLDKDEKDKSIDSTMYRGMKGYLLYLIASRPDIRKLEARVLDLGRFLFFPCVITNFGADPSTFQHDQGFRCEVLPFPYLFLTLALISMASGQEPTTSKAQGKRPT
ncbi:hypothetical protein CK203_014343 [Vitis vinifera]|uniref:Uncharacterized protein n=1 Tax=Vitis vinifera TaxID=29760 RepID=A0A438K569_VITVI|nr:hypothetical protein CK203_014343 [Vitis vinifera]